MFAIDRVMRAYTSKHSLKQDQSDLVRTELSAFIGDLMSGKRPKFSRSSAAEECASSVGLDRAAFGKSLSEQRHVVEMAGARASPVATVKY